MTPHLRLYRGGESNNTNGKIEESPAKWHNQNVTRSQGKPPLRRRFGETFFQGFPKAVHRVIKFVGSDRRLRTSPLRGYCWELDFRVKPPLSEMLPNLFAGPNERKPSIPEGIRRTLRSTNSKTSTFGTKDIAF